MQVLHEMKAYKSVCFFMINSSMGCFEHVVSEQ